MLKAEAEAGAAPPPKSTVDAFNTYINIWIYSTKNIKFHPFLLIYYDFGYK
jgi:hypothetical protein